MLHAFQISDSNQFHATFYTWIVATNQRTISNIKRKAKQAVGSDLCARIAAN